MATTSVRTEAKARLVELLAAHASLSGVQVSYGWPGRDVQAEGVFVGQDRGAVDVASMKSGRKSRNDRFTVDIVCAAFTPGQDSCQAAEERAAVLYGAVEDTIADYPTLNSLSGITHAVQSGEVSTESGPTDEGWGAVVTCQIEFLARLT